MVIPQPIPVGVSLRDLKKKQTLDVIGRVALTLFAENGYQETTLDDIARAANVSKRTIFTYYRSKNDILFQDEPNVYRELESALLSRPPGATTLEVLETFFDSFVPNERAVLRKRIIGSSDELRQTERARFVCMEELLAESLARDLGTNTEDLRPLLLAATVTAAFNVVYDRLLEPDNVTFLRTGSARPFDQVLDLLRSGIIALDQS